MHNFKLINSENASIEELYSNKGTEQWLMAYLTIAGELAINGAGNMEMNNRAVTVSIPRGGSPMKSVMEELFPNSRHILSNDGAYKIESQNLIPELGADYVLLADGIIATGRSIIRHLQEIERQGVDLKNTVVISPIITQLGVENIHAFSPDTLVLSAHLEAAGTYVDFSSGKPRVCEPDIEGAVFVIGDIEIDEEGIVTSFRLGDFGDMYEEWSGNE